MIQVKEYLFDPELIGEGWHIPQEQIEELYHDARWLSPHMELFLAQELKGKLAPSKKSPFDIYDADGKKQEVRCMTHNGVSFAPSKDTGSGRQFNEDNFFEKLREIDGYIVCDVIFYPLVHCYFTPKKVVKEWYGQGKFRKNASILRTKFLKLVVDQNRLPAESCSSARSE